ncbi:hypothetical protein KR222_008624 [Zaprionus bogoriensis]|nr:hypothetical protein KR222_008624 [Zaprionus bogoriensis]
MSARAAASPTASPTIPIVGILCVDIASRLREVYGSPYSFIAASYVKILEAGGALVVPIWIGRERVYYEEIMKQVNGVLLPGGAVCLDEEEALQYPQLSNDCVKSARHIYELAMQRNEAGDYFPLWGTCLGFQLLMINAAGSKEVRIDCPPMFTSLPLQFAPDYRDSQLLGQLPAHMAEQMCSEPFACHQHRFAITVGNLRSFRLHHDWHVLATAQWGAGNDGLEADADADADADAKRIITLIEHRRFPIFGSQFHPERAAFEQLFAAPDSCSAAHTSTCIRLAQYFADSFVAACRCNGNSFASAAQKAQHMICNWRPVFSGLLPKSHWLQVYLFERDEDYPKAETDVEFGLN